MKKVRRLISLVVCCSFVTSLSFGTEPISMESMVTGSETTAGSSGTNYQLGYEMISFGLSHKLKIKDGGMEGELDCKINSLRHGVFFSSRYEKKDGDIFYGGVIKLLKGSCDWKLNSKAITDCKEKDAWGYEVITNIGIKFALNKKKTVKLGPASGISMLLEDCSLNDLSQKIKCLYLPIGIISEIVLGKGWVLCPNLFFNFTIFGDIELRVPEYNPGDIKYKMSKAKSMDIKINLSKQVSKKIGLQIEPFFTYRDFGASEKCKMFFLDGTSGEITGKAHGYEFGFIFGIKF